MGLIPLLTGKSVNLLNSYWPFILTSLTANSLKAGLYILFSGNSSEAFRRKWRRRLILTARASEPPLPAS